MFLLDLSATLKKNKPQIINSGHEVSTQID